MKILSVECTQLLKHLLKETVMSKARAKHHRNNSVQSFALQRLVNLSMRGLVLLHDVFWKLQSYRFWHNFIRNKAKSQNCAITTPSGAKDSLHFRRDAWTVIKCLGWDVGWLQHERHAGKDCKEPSPRWVPKKYQLLQKPIARKSGGPKPADCPILYKCHCSCKTKRNRWMEQYQIIYQCEQLLCLKMSIAHVATHIFNIKPSKSSFALSRFLFCSNRCLLSIPECAGYSLAF